MGVLERANIAAWIAIGQPSKAVSRTFFDTFLSTICFFAQKLLPNGFPIKRKCPSHLVGDFFISWPSLSDPGSEAAVGIFEYAF